MIKRILLSVSSNPAGAAETKVALDLAARHGAEVTGFVAANPDHIASEVPQGLVLTPSHLGALEYRIRQSRSTAQKALSELERMCREREIPFHDTDVATGTEEAIAQAWRFHDLCVIPTHPWDPGVESPPGSSAILHLVVMGLRPLLAVPEATLAIPPSKALVALSGSVESVKSLKHFIQLQPYPGIAMHLVNVGSPKPATSRESGRELLDQARAYVEAHGFSVTTSCLGQADDRVEALLNEADRVDAEMFVIGSSYKKFLTFELYGKHARGILERSTRPVFLSH